MKKLLLLLFMISFIGIFTVQAAPVSEKKVMVSFDDVGISAIAHDCAIKTNIQLKDIDPVNVEAPLLDDNIYRKILYETTINNDNADKKREAITVGDHLPIND